MKRTLSLVARLCLAGMTLAPPSASAGPASPNPSLAPPASAVPIHYPWWRDRDWHGERHYRQFSYERYCARLRRACIYKEERGEVGQGNCRRYRAECGRRYY